MPPWFDPLEPELGLPAVESPAVEPPRGSWMSSWLEAAARRRERKREQTGPGTITDGPSVSRQRSHLANCKRSLTVENEAERDAARLPSGATSWMPRTRGFSSTA